MYVRTLLIALCAIISSVCQSASAETIRAYHIGNSLTDNIYYGGLRRIAEQSSDIYKYGKQVSPGVPLDYNWQYKSITGSIYSQGPYGKYKDALKGYTWDALTLEPFDNKIAGSTGDLQMVKNFINYAKTKSPNIKSFIYERWPRRTVDASGKFLPFDYTKLWTTKYVASTDRYSKSAETRGYFESLVNQVNSALPTLKNKVHLVPVGDVLAELDKRIKAKQISGLSNITDLYADTLHMNNKGAYLVGLTFYTTMFDQSPVGQTVPGAYGSINPTLASQIQHAVWDVVSTNKYSGVTAVPASASVPEPTIAIGLLAMLPMLRARRRR